MLAIFGKNKIKYIFIVYALCLVNFIIFKYFGNMQRVIERINNNISHRNYEYWIINLRPFSSITSSIDSYMRFGIGLSTIYLIGNIIAFIPMGFLIPLIMRKPSFVKTIGISIVTIIGIEIIQFVTYLGSADIDDVILNMLGCVIGYMVNVISLALHKQLYQRFRALS